MVTTETGSMSATQWARTVEEARRVQQQLLKRVRVEPLAREPGYIVAVDASFTAGQVIAVACLFTYPALALIDQSVVAKAITFPYIPGYLSFREGPAVMEALEGLAHRPELIMFDGQGIAHPRGIGLASHIGVLCDLPAIGCAKSRLVGEFDMPGRRKGSHRPLIYKGKTVGVVLRTRDAVQPLFVSPGHRIDFDGALRITMGCVGKYRLPEPLRIADMLSKQMRKNFTGGGSR